MVNSRLIGYRVGYCSVLSCRLSHFSCGNSQSVRYVRSYLSDRPNHSWNVLFSEELTLINSAFHFMYELIISLRERHLCSVCMRTEGMAVSEKLTAMRISEGVASTSVFYAAPLRVSVPISVHLPTQWRSTLD